jgi:signal-transduction protein with cAMP-binding, CBS, and nucleotidyltransferase domain
MAKKLKIKFEEIQASALFAGVPPKIVKKIALIPRAQEHPAGDIIIRENDTGEFMFVVLSGQVDITKAAGDKDIFLATLGPGTFIGEGALVSGAPRNATVKAKTPVKIAYFDRPAYNKMIMIDHAISATLMKVHKERVKDQVKKINLAKSKAFIISSVVALIPLIQSFVLPHLGELSAHIPPGLLAMIGPAGAAAAFKLQQSDMAGLVGKIDKM